MRYAAWLLWNDFPEGAAIPGLMKDVLAAAAGLPQRIRLLIALGCEILFPAETPYRRRVVIHRLLDNTPDSTLDRWRTAQKLCALFTACARRSAQPAGHAAAGAAQCRCRIALSCAFTLLLPTGSYASAGNCAAMPVAAFWLLGWMVVRYRKSSCGKQSAASSCAIWAICERRRHYGCRQGKGDCPDAIVACPGTLAAFFDIMADHALDHQWHYR